MKKRSCIALLCLFLGCQAFALEPRTAHTFQLAEGETPPVVSLQDLHWIVGNWNGTIFGQQFEEVWNPPSAGSMMGMFKILDDDELMFYEMQLITRDAEGISLKVKHFEPDFAAWEEKAEYVRFPLIGIEDNAIHFSGFSFYRLDENNLEAYLVLRSGEEIHEEKLTYQRRQ